MLKTSDACICVSRFTEGLANGESVQFEIGEHVTYRAEGGKTEQIKIASARMQHETGCYGYEAIFPDPDGGRWFAPAKWIIDWEGKR